MRDVCFRGDSGTTRQFLPPFSGCRYPWAAWSAGPFQSSGAIHSVRATQCHAAEVTVASVAGEELERCGEGARKLLTGWLSYKIINQTCISLKARKITRPPFDYTFTQIKVIFLSDSIDCRVQFSPAGAAKRKHAKSSRDNSIPLQKEDSLRRVRGRREKKIKREDHPPQHTQLLANTSQPCVVLLQLLWLLLASVEDGTSVPCHIRSPWYRSGAQLLVTEWMMIICTRVSRVLKLCWRLELRCFS